ncbi:hypothetical protein AAIH06_34240, partial [Pseudomonas aeruginosa]
KLDSLAAIIEKFCEPQVAIVSLTITEKGYCIDPATGALDTSNPRIIHDLQNPEEPHSAPGILVEALKRRGERHRQHNTAHRAAAEEILIKEGASAPFTHRINRDTEHHHQIGDQR